MWPKLETDEILSGSGIDCPVCKKYLTIPGTAITTDLPPEPTNINTGKNVADSLKATQLAARAAQAAQAAQAARPLGVHEPLEIRKPLGIHGQISIS